MKLYLAALHCSLSLVGLVIERQGMDIFKASARGDVGRIEDIKHKPNFHFTENQQNNDIYF